MVNQVLADVVLVTHAVFVAFVVIGGLTALRWRWVPILHLPAAAWGVFVEFTGRVCPLTPLENSLRRAAGASGYQGSFLEHYLLPLIYPSGLTETTQWLLGSALIVANAVVYLFVWRQGKHAPTRSATSSVSN